MVAPSPFASLDPVRQKIAFERAAKHVQQVMTDAPVMLSQIQKALKKKQLVEGLTLPSVFRPLMRPARYKGVHGGRGSGKSHAFAELLLSRALKTETRAVCVREHQVSLEQSVKRLLEDKIEYYGLGQDFRVLNTHIEAPHNGIFIFQGMKNHTAESIKSLEGYHVAWFEEAQSASERSLTLLRPTIREEGSELWFSWNPRLATDPVDVLLRGTPIPPSATVIEANYADNPDFPEVLQQEMEWDLRRDPEKYAHVWKGQYEKHSEARVFKNWKVEEFETPESAVFYLGADWGFSVDPTVMVRCFIQGKTLFIDYEAYKIGCRLEDIPALFDQVPGSRSWQSIADSARPETIDYLTRNGFPNMQAAKKGKDSVAEGIIFLQSMDIVIHPRCVHARDEFTMYSFKKDPLTDMVTPILEDKKNHVIDSVRYAIEEARVPLVEATWGRKR